MIVRARWTSLAALAALSIGCSASRRPEMIADLVLTDGAVVTEDPRHPEAQAVAVRGGSIVAVGTADPPGGKIERDGRGEPTGVFVDNAQGLIEKARPEPSREQIKDWLGLSLQRLVEAGLTEIHDASVDPEDVDAYRELADAGRLPLRIYLMWNGIGKSRIEP